MPILDDFSYNSYFPDNLLWEDSAVFVNRSFPINPVTIGVATFDGLNADGKWGPSSQTKYEELKNQSEGTEE